jgi:5-formyltetrahydrofolate cyclo-ligase
MNIPEQAAVKLSPASAQEQRAELSSWRKTKRQALLDGRETMPAADHRQKSLCILDALSTQFKHRCTGLVGFYWPFCGEINVRPFIELLLKNGGSAALPVVVAKQQPLQFRIWKPGILLTRGVYNIPHPREGEAVQPDVLIVPLVGFDPACYRLGYGGGFYDRTLSAAKKKTLTIGVGFEMARLETIRPQSYDIPMDFIVTESHILTRNH